jgi:hypothetical protein
MSAIIRLLDAEISKYEALIKNLKASRDAIAAAEALPSATGAKRRGRPAKNAAKNGAKSPKPTGTGRKRGRPRKNPMPAAAPAVA